MVRPVQINLINAAISSIIAVVIGLPAAIILGIIRFFVRALVKAKYGKNADLVPGRDAMCNARFVGGYDSLLHMFAMIGGPVTKEELIALVKKNLLDLKHPNGSWVHPKLRASFSWFLGYRIFSVDQEKFDVNRHFEYVFDNDGKPLVCETEQEVENMIELLERPRDPEAPMWKFHIFYTKVRPFGKSFDEASDEAGNSRGPSTCLVFRMDHIIADGGSILMAVLQPLWDPETQFDPQASFQNVRPFTRTQRMLFNAKGFLLTPLAACRTLFPGNGLMGDVSPLKRGDSTTEGRFFVYPKTIPLEQLTAIRKATDVKINPILSACLTKALFRFSQDAECEAQKLHCQGEGGVLLEKAISKWKYTMYIGHTLWTPGDPIECTNRVAALPYTVKSCELSSTDRLETLRAVNHTVQDPSRSMHAWALGCLFDTYVNALPLELWNLLTQSRVRQATATFTNLRGPTVMPRMLGHVLKHAPFINIWKGLGIGLSTVTFEDELVVAFVGRRSSLRSREELRKIQDLFMEEVDKLYSAVEASKPDVTDIVCCE